MASSQEEIRIVRRYFDAVAGAEMDVFLAEPDRHPTVEQ
jgi:hypothetical protein